MMTISNRYTGNIYITNVTKREWTNKCVEYGGQNQDETDSLNRKTEMFKTLNMDATADHNNDMNRRGVFLLKNITLFK